jgi:hypothetical protein
VLALAACSKTATDKPADAAAAPAKPPLVKVNGNRSAHQLFEDYAQAVARKPRASCRRKIAIRSRRTWCASC